MNGFRIGEFFVFLEERDHVAGLAAAEALEDTPGRRDIERRSFLVVKRAVGKKIGAPALEAHKLPYHLDNVGPVHYFLYGSRGNHDGKVRTMALLQ